MVGSIDYAGDAAKRKAMQKAKKNGGSLYFGSGTPGGRDREAILERRKKIEALRILICGK